MKLAVDLAYYLAMVNPKQALSNYQSSTESHHPAAQPRAATGRFISRYAERRGSAIALRLPQSLDNRLRQTVGWRSKADNKALTAWIEAAILEKLQRQASADTETARNTSSAAEAELNCGSAWLDGH